MRAPLIKEYRHRDAKFNPDGPLRVDSVRVEWIRDESPDLSWIGKYTDEYDPWAIVVVGRHAGAFVCDVPHNELPDKGMKYRYFIPCAGEEEKGSDNYRTYALQDYKRIITYGSEWCCQGCVAKAEVSYAIGGSSRRLECFHSDGLWGIESDSDKDFLRETEDEQLEDLAGHLGHFGIATTAEQLRKISNQERTA